MFVFLESSTIEYYINAVLSVHLKSVICQEELIDPFQTKTRILRWYDAKQNKIASSKRKLGCASVMLLLSRIASLNGVFVVEDEQVI